MRWSEEAPLCACCGAHPGCVSGVEPGQRVCPDCRADLIHALARSQWDERDEMTHIEESLVIGEFEMSEQATKRYMLQYEYEQRRGKCIDCGGSITVDVRAYTDTETRKTVTARVRSACNCTGEGYDPYKGK